MKRWVIVLTVLLSVSLWAQDVHLNKIVDKLEHDKIPCGIWVSALHPSNAAGLVDMNGYPDYEEALQTPMVDYILIDMEHQPYDISALRNFLLALNSKREVVAKGNLQPNIATLVRIPAEGNQPTHAMIKQVLDIGVHGVVVPHVRTADQAREIIKACRYTRPESDPLSEPGGTRGASPWLCAYLWGLSMPDYLDHADVWPLNPQGDLLSIVMIEDKEGMENVEEIVRVPGIGAVIFGPYDYSFHIGHPGETQHAEVLAGWERVKAACDAADVPLVGFANPDNVLELVQQEYRMLLFGHDVRNVGNIITILETLKPIY